MEMKFDLDKDSRRRIYDPPLPWWLNDNNQMGNFGLRYFENAIFKGVIFPRIILFGVKINLMIIIDTIRSLGINSNRNWFYVWFKSNIS